MTNNQELFRACHCCGLIHQMPNVDATAVQANSVACCTRCQTWLVSPTPRRVSASRTAAAAVGAFILFWPAILLPILQIERLGQTAQQSILSGIIDLFHHGSYFVGGVVLLFSIIFPLMKIVLLIELSCLEWLGTRHKAFTLRMMEHVGKWSMMDVMLLAFLVMLVKLGNLVHFEFGPAVIAFVACVAMSMAASLSFDPHSIWETPSDA
ncbi:Paraquat-inducible protein A [Rubripirellula obstinata]|uniref:Paraquat-inducible protein A n=2 Tax=Rubripirellula obstinata TaxID=406547 RepID=A0A5B1CQM2_9BACT|nr:Paraquat-inducible protein A [Rubripirellula obstinata]